MLEKLSCQAAARAIGNGEISAVELTNASLQAIEEWDYDVGAFLEVAGDRARTRAAAIDADRERSAMPLAGVPIALKDNLCVEGRQVTAGSRILEGFCPPYTATAVQRLEAAGAICIGKTNMDEFAMGSSTENSALGQTANPWDLDRVAGGSSGGSAAAVASRQVLAALGSDTGGSIRQPASYCGVVGLKPTYGRVSRYGLIAFASSLDQIGPIATCVDDAALLLEVVGGHDPYDSTSFDRPSEFTDLTPLDPHSLRLGVPRNWLAEGLQAGVRTVFEQTLDALEAVGVQLIEVELPHERYAVATYYVIATAEASSNLARYDGVRYGLRKDEGSSPGEMFSATRSAGFGNEVKRRILLGTYVLSAGYYEAYYGRALRLRTLLRRDFDVAFGRVDAVVGPTAPTTAFLLGENVDDPLSMYLNDVYTVTANLTGLPALSVPCGLDGGLPVGFQIFGQALDEATILGVGRLVEELCGPMPPAPHS